MTFPTISIDPGTSITRIDSSLRDDFSFYHVVQGQDPAFYPAGLPGPDWFVAVNPYGFDDPEADIHGLEESFGDADPDVALTLVRGDFETICQALWAQARDDAEDHYECDNGGAYMAWKISDDLVMVAGMDNGGSDIAQTGSQQAAEMAGQVLASHGDSHFTLDKVLDENYASSPRHEGVRVLVDQLIGARRAVRAAASRP